MPAPPSPASQSAQTNTWQGRRVSNPQPSVLETDALPIELHPLRLGRPIAGAPTYRSSLPLSHFFLDKRSAWGLGGQAPQFRPFFPGLRGSWHLRPRPPAGQVIRNSGLRLHPPPADAKPASSARLRLSCGRATPSSALVGVRPESAEPG